MKFRKRADVPIVTKIPAIIFLASVVAASGQVFTPPLSARAAMEACALRQRQSALVMLVAVERQRVSTKRQPELPRFAGRPLQDQAVCPPLPTKDLNQIVQESAAEQQLDPVLVQNVVRKESAGWPCAVSPKGAQGLMQLMPETAEMLGVQNPFDPKENVVAGTRLLKALMDRYGGNAPLALAAYNAGPKRVNEAGGIPEIPETQEYVRTIMDRVSAMPIRDRISAH